MSSLRPLSDPPSWIDVVNRGGLTAPTDEFFGVVVNLERCFLDFYGAAGVHTCTNAVTNLVALMRNGVDCTAIPARAVFLFAKLRVIIRMRNEGLISLAEKLAKSNARKMRKFVN